MLKNLIIVVVLAFLAKWFIGILDWTGYFQRIYNHAPGTCRKLQGIDYGSEDIQVLPNGIAFISSGLRLRDNDVYKNRPGRIYTFDFKKPQEPPRELTIRSDLENFKLVSPHGINVWTDEVTGDIYLFVISHHPTEIVDKFHYSESSDTLQHMKRISGDPNFHHLNDLVVVGEDQFYFSNYFYASDLFEFTLGLRWGSLGYYDGTKSKLIDKGLAIPNGMALSPDKKLLYLAHCGDEEIRVYKRHSNNSLAFLHAIKVGTKLDNLDVDMATGDIWMGAHSVMHKIIRYMDDPREHSPSQVMRVKVSAAGKATSVEEMFSNDGSLLSASSVAVVYGKRLLIGTIAGPALYCETK